MKNLIATICLTIAVLLGSAGSALSEGQWFPTDKPNCHIWNPRPFPGETATWSGNCLNGKAHGFGRTTWRFLKDSKLVERFTEGDLHNGVRSGQVTIIYENGDVYVGTLNPTNGKRDGLGTYTYSNGWIKKGIWLEGKFQHAVIDV
jgi:hypothetical protein